MCNLPVLCLCPIPGVQQRPTRHCAGIITPALRLVERVAICAVVTVANGLGTLMRNLGGALTLRGHEGLLIELTRQALPLLRASKGSIVNIASFSSTCGIPGQAIGIGFHAGQRGLVDQADLRVGVAEVRGDPVLLEPRLGQGGRQAGHGELHGGELDLSGIVPLQETSLTVPSHYGRIWTAVGP